MGLFGFTWFLWDYVGDEKYNFSRYINLWRQTLKDVHEKYGAWETRKNYKTWEFLEV